MLYSCAIDFTGECMIHWGVSTTYLVLDEFNQPHISRRLQQYDLAAECWILASLKYLIQSLSKGIASWTVWRGGTITVSSTFSRLTYGIWVFRQQEIMQTYPLIDICELIAILLFFLIQLGTPGIAPVCMAIIKWDFLFVVMYFALLNKKKVPSLQVRYNQYCIFLHCYHPQESRGYCAIQVPYHQQSFRLWSSAFMYTSIFL